MNIYAGETLSFKWKVLAIFMSVVLACSLCPVPAFADDGASDQAAVATEGEGEGTETTDEGDGNTTDENGTEEPGINPIDEGEDEITEEEEPPAGAINIEGATIALSLDEVKWRDDGTTTVPEVTSVTLADNTILETEDYTIEFPEVTGPGDYEIKVTGKAPKYYGTATVKYKVFSVKLLYKSYKSGKWGGWKSTSTSGTTSGTATFRKIAIKLSEMKNISGGIKYRVKYSGKKDWSSYSSNGTAVGNGGRIEGIQVELTGDIAKKYDVYYRVNSPKICWMGWACNGQTAGATGMSIPIRGFQVRLVLKDSNISGSTNLHYAAFRGTNYKEAVDKILLIKAQHYTASKKKYSKNYKKRLMVVTKTYNRMIICQKNSKGKWYIYKSFICSTGAKATQTGTGVYYLGYNGRRYAKGEKFYNESGTTCWWWTSFTRYRLFHSQIYLHNSKSKLAYPDQLGKNVSHGCIRMELKEAYWVYHNMALGTKVVIYGDLLF